MDSKLVFQLQAIDNASGTIKNVADRLKSVQDQKKIDILTRTTALMMPEKIIKEGMKQQEKGIAAGGSGLAQIAAQRQKEQKKYDTASGAKAEKFDLARKNAAELAAKESSIINEQQSKLAEISAKKQEILNKQSEINSAESNKLAEIAVQKQELASQQKKNNDLLNSTLAKIAADQQAKENQLYHQRSLQQNELANQSNLQTNRMISLLDKQKAERRKIDKLAAAASAEGDPAKFKAMHQKRLETISRHQREQENRKILDLQAMEKVQKKLDETQKQIDSVKNATLQQRESALDAYIREALSVEEKEKSIISQEKKARQQASKQKQMLMRQQNAITSQEQKVNNQYNKQLDSVRKNIQANQNKQQQIYDDALKLYDEHAERAKELDEAEKKIQEALQGIDQSAPELTFLDKMSISATKGSKYLKEGADPYLSVSKQVFSSLMSLYGAYFKVGQAIVSFTGTIISFGVSLVSTLTSAFASVMNVVIDAMSYVTELGQSFESLNFALGAMLLSNENLKITGSVAGRQLDDISASLAYSGELYTDMVKKAAELPGEAEDFMQVYTTAFASAKRLNVMPKEFIDMAAKVGAISIVLGNTSKNAANSLNQMFQGTVTKQNVLNNKFLTTIGMQTKEFNKLKPEERLAKVEEIIAKFEKGLEAYKNSFEALLSTMQTHMKEITRMGTMPLFIHIKRIMRDINKFFDQVAPEIIAVFREISYDILDMIMPAEMAFRYILANWQYYLAVLIEKAFTFAQKNSELFHYVPVVLDVIANAFRRLFKVIAAFSGVKVPKREDLPKIQIEMPAGLAAFIAAQKAIKFGKDVLSPPQDYRSTFDPTNPAEVKPFYERMGESDKEYYSAFYKPGAEVKGLQQRVEKAFDPKNLSSPIANQLGIAGAAIVAPLAAFGAVVAGKTEETGKVLGNAAAEAEKQINARLKAVPPPPPPPKELPTTQTEEMAKHLPDGILAGIGKGMAAPLQLGPIALAARNIAGVVAAFGVLLSVMPSVATGLLAMGGATGFAASAGLSMVAFIHPVSLALLILSVGFANMMKYPAMVALSLKYFGQMLDNIAGALLALGAIFDPLADALGYIFAALIPPIVAFVDAVFGIINAIAQLAKKIFTPIVKVVAGIVKVIFGFVGIVAAIVAAIAKFVELLAWGVVWVADAVAKMPIVKDVIDFIAWIGKKLAEFGSALLGVIIDIVSVFDEAIAKIKKMLNMAPTPPGETWTAKTGLLDFRKTLGATTDIEGKGTTINQDFSGSKFEVQQKFEEGFDPDRVAVAFIGELGRLGEKKIQSGFAPLYSVR